MRELDRDSTQRHRTSPGQQAARPNQDRLACEIGTGNAHHEAEVGEEAVIGTEDRRAQRVAARRAMPSLGLS
jgi:hypothetical protein